MTLEPQDQQSRKGIIFMSMASVIVLDNRWAFHDELDLCSKKGLKRLANWILKGKITVLLQDEHEKIMALDIYRPIVVQLLKWGGYKPKTEEIDFSKEAVFVRDNNFCQFWHFDGDRKFKYRCSHEERSLEHLMPTSRNGASSFLNCVCACKVCNVRIKGNKTPEESGLKLIRQPFIPKRNRNEFVRINFNYNPEKETHRIFKQYYPNYVTV
jgi:hypothetical protein